MSADMIVIFRLETRRSENGGLPYASFFMMYSVVFYALVPAGIDLWRYHEDVLIVDHPCPLSMALGTLLAGHSP